MCALAVALADTNGAGRPEAIAELLCEVDPQIGVVLWDSSKRAFWRFDRVSRSFAGGRGDVSRIDVLLFHNHEGKDYVLPELPDTVIRIEYGGSGAEGLSGAYGIDRDLENREDVRAQIGLEEMEAFLAWVRSSDRGSAEIPSLLAARRQGCALTALTMKCMGAIALFAEPATGEPGPWVDAEDVPDVRHALRKMDFPRNGMGRELFTALPDTARAELRPQVLTASWWESFRQAGQAFSNAVRREWLRDGRSDGWDRVHTLLECVLAGGHPQLRVVATALSALLDSKGGMQ